MKFATISTHHASSQPALVDGDRVYTLPFPDMYAVMEAGVEAAAGKASKDSLAIDEVKFLSPLKPKTLRDAYAQIEIVAALFPGRAQRQEFLLHLKRHAHRVGGRMIEFDRVVEENHHSITGEAF